MAGSGEIRVPVRPDMSKMYEGMAAFNEAMAAGHRTAAEACEATAKNFRRVAESLREPEQERPKPGLVDGITGA